MSKILFVATVANHIQEHYLPFIRMLQEQGHQVEVACQLNVPLKGFPVWEVPFSRVPYSKDNITAYREVRSLLINGGYDLVHVHTPIASFLTRLAARKLPIPVLYTVHGFHFFKGAPLKNWLVYHTAERLASRWTAGMIVMNSEDLLAARGFGLREELDLFYVPGVGVNFNYYGRAGDRGQSREKLGISNDLPVTVCIAEFIPRKNHSWLLQSWRLVTKAIPSALLWLVGRGELQGELQQMVTDLGLVNNVEFLGYRSDIPDILTAADLLVLTSKHEGLTRVIMEAMAAARPVVASDVRGNRDLVQDGVNGCLVPLDQVNTLAEALIKLLNDPSLAEKMGQAGRRIVDTYSLDRVKEQMLTIYNRYLEKDSNSE